VSNLPRIWKHSLISKVFQSLPVSGSPTIHQSIIPREEPAGLRSQKPSVNGIMSTTMFQQLRQIILKVYRRSNYCYGVADEFTDGVLGSQRASNANDAPTNSPNSLHVPLTAAQHSDSTAGSVLIHQIPAGGSSSADGGMSSRISMLADSTPIQSTATGQLPLYIKVAQGKIAPRLCSCLAS
jgi:hypothetical protein